MLYAALWSRAGKGLTSWLSCIWCFLVFLSLSHVVSYNVGQVWHLIVSIPDLCLLTHLEGWFRRPCWYLRQFGFESWKIFIFSINTGQLRYLDFQGNGENTSSLLKFEIADYEVTRIRVHVQYAYSRKIGYYSLKMFVLKTELKLWHEKYTNTTKQAERNIREHWNKQH